ncbi:MAG: 50S ribosomal protein L32 [Kiritimatiellae bacterium]|jgi:large subunit ribosomal protein L32|nr:50S ribosomal protein L32 [Kiritimatiellia bacterium]
MAVPKRKSSKSVVRTRKRTIKAKVTGTAACPECGAFKELHRACKACGYYKGKQVINVEAV